MKETFFKNTDGKHGEHFEPYMNWGADDMAVGFEKLHGVKPRIKGFHKGANTEDSRKKCPLCNIDLAFETEHHCIKFIYPDNITPDWVKIKDEGKKINDAWIEKIKWVKGMSNEEIAKRESN